MLQKCWIRVKKEEFIVSWWGGSKQGSNLFAEKYQKKIIIKKWLKKSTAKISLINDGITYQKQKNIWPTSKSKLIYQKKNVDGISIYYPQSDLAFGAYPINLFLTLKGNYLPVR